MPQVFGQPERDGVEESQRVVELGHAVVTLDLGGVRVEHQALGLDERPGQSWPVVFRVHELVRVEVAHRPVQLGLELQVAQLLVLLVQAVHEVGHFLAQGGRGGELPVGARDHAGLAVLPGQGLQPGQHFLLEGQQQVLFRILHHQRVRHVVDVFRGAAEVDVLLDAPELALFVQFLLNIVLHGLDVMVGGLLDGLDPQSPLHAELFVQTVQVGDIQGGQLVRLVIQSDHVPVQQEFHPFDLDLRPVLDQGVF